MSTGRDRLLRVCRWAGVLVVLAGSSVGVVWAGGSAADAGLECACAADLLSTCEAPDEAGRAAVLGGFGLGLSKVFDTTDFPPRWQCGTWTALHGWIHIIADLGIWSAYMSIPLVLVYYIRRRTDLPFPRIFWLFAAFILACGIGHLIEAGIFWWPAYRLLGVVKLFTAIVSWVTVIALLPIVPKALELPGIAKVNEQLCEELSRRESVEAALRMAKQSLDSQKRALDEHAIVAITDTAGRITYVNDKFCEISQYSAEELIGQDHRVVNSGHHPKQFFVELWRTIARGDVWRGEVCNRAKDGSIYWVDTTIVPFRGEAGRVAEYVAIRADITDRKRAEQEIQAHAIQLQLANIELATAKSAAEQIAVDLERSNRELDDFAYIASHDLKEPLRGIHNYATFLLEDYADRLDDDGRGKLETLPRLCQRLESFIDSLLHFSRLGRTELGIAETDLNVVVADVLESLRPGLEERGVAVRLANSLPTITCDAPRVREVFGNLITNAMKYNERAEKWIEIGVCDGDEVGETERPASAVPEFYVRDNGLGIPERHLESIFRIFKRLHARDKFGGGTGAGLTIVKKIVELHGGRIRVESEPGAGTTFYFTLQETMHDSGARIENAGDPVG